MKMQSERVEATYLDPRRGFEPARVPLEMRRDPLTGHTSRLLPDGTFQGPAQLDLAALAEQSRAACPFCEQRIETHTPKFPPEVVPDGRIRRGEAVLFPNLSAYAKWSAVSVYSPRRHALALDELTEALIRDNLAAQVAFARAALVADADSRWISINGNHLPPSGSSIFHPHLQGSANPVPTTMQRLLAEIEPTRFREYVHAERGGERHLGSTGSADWFAAFAPIGPAEIRACVFGAPSVERLPDELVAELAHGLDRALKLYAELGFQSFNLALSGAPDGAMPTILRLVARAYYGPLGRSDAMWSERLQWEAAVDVAPERVAEVGRARFGAAVLT